MIIIIDDSTKNKKSEMNEKERNDRERSLHQYKIIVDRQL